MSLFELDDVFTYQDANDIKRLWASDAAPADPGDGEVWLDTSVTPNRLKRYIAASGWETICDMTAGELLTLIKTVHGPGSGLDADKLDGKESVEFFPKNSDGSLIDISGTDLDNLVDSGIYRGGNLINNPDDSVTTWWGILHAKHTSLYQSQLAWNIQHLELAIMYMRVMGSGTWGSWFKIWTQYSDGSGSGLDADKLDGQEGSYYQDASNLNAGTLNKNLLPAEVVRTDQDTNVSAHTEWQDNYQVRLGTGSDLRLLHNGSDSYIDNYTGHLCIRQLSHGNNIYIQAEDASGTLKTLSTLDPDTDRVTTKLDRASLPDLWYDGETGDHESPFIQTSQENIVQINTNVIRNFAYAFTSTPRVVLTQHIQANIYLKTVSTTSITFRTDIANTPITYFALGTLT